MKILSTTCFVHGKIEELIKATGSWNQYHHQYSIYCRARGIKHANELCQDIGPRVFHPSYTGSAGDKIADYFNHHPEVTYILQDTIALFRENEIVTNLQVEEELRKNES